MAEKSVPITLKDGKTYQLRYEWASLCRLKREQGISIFEFARKQLFGTPDPLEITAVIWAGLIHAKPDLTVEEVEKDLIDEHKVFEYLEVVSDELVESLLGPEKADEIKKKMGSSLEALAGMDTPTKAST